MHKVFLILFLMFCVTGCNHHKVTHQETAAAYYHASNAADFNDLKKTISDSITIIAGDYVMPYSRESFYKAFQWDSVFRTSYKVVHLKDIDDQVIASVTLQSPRLEFLGNSPMSCRYKISFNSGKISKIEEVECENADWALWGRKVDSLVSYIHNNHPELDGFINDMTMQGALNYTKAIELYEHANRIQE